MDTDSANQRLEIELRTALLWLYDPGALRRSPLVPLLGVDGQRNPAGALRESLIAAIESLRPSGATPPGTKAWRVYQVLRRRYIEQVPQRQVAADLGLSLRQLQREEKLARAVLADFLSQRYGLATKPPLPEAAAAEDPQGGVSPDRAQELAWLRKSAPAQMLDVGDLMREIQETLSPLLTSLDVTVEWQTQADLPRVFAQAPLLHQGLLNLLSVAAQLAPGRHVEVRTTSTERGQVRIVIESSPRDVAAPPPIKNITEALEVAAEFIDLLGGTLVYGSDLTSGEAFVATVTLTAPERFTVLVVDDNADTLQLFERYLSGSRYHFRGLQQAEQTVSLATELAPRVIVLDVMMPGCDGWALLGQLREQPETRNTPVIVCSILPHERLAQALGATEFIRKPVGRADFLAALDRQVALRPTALEQAPEGSQPTAERSDHLNV